MNALEARAEIARLNGQMMAIDTVTQEQATQHQKRVTELARVAYPTEPEPKARLYR